MAAKSAKQSTAFISLLLAVFWVDVQRALQTLNSCWAACPEDAKEIQDARETW